MRRDNGGEEYTEKVQEIANVRGGGNRGREGEKERKRIKYYLGLKGLTTGREREREREKIKRYRKEEAKGENKRKKDFQGDSSKGSKLKQEKTLSIEINN